MKIIIDIPETMYDWFDNGFPDEDDAEILWGLVKNGTLLPKGHGDLIDRKELLKQPMDLTNYPSNYVRIAPTIIAADEAESEE